VNTKAFRGGEEEILPLTSLRFVAALYVFLFHIHIRWHLTSSRFASNLLDQGAIGMSLFFMLSGFVLAYRYRTGVASYRDYLLNRFARIYPVYAAAALVTVPWIGVSLTAGSPVGIGRGLGQLALLLVANVLLIQAWFPQMFPYWNDGASWSISTEAFFYALFPFALARLNGQPARRVAWVALAAYVLAVLPGLSWILFEPKPSHGIFYSMPIYRMPEFILGVCACLLAPQVWRIARGDGACLVAVLGLAAYLGVAGAWLPLYVGHNWVVLPVIALVLVTLGQSRGFLKRVLSWGPLVWAGKVSYCFYSFQPLVLLPLIEYREQLVRLVPWLRNNRALAVLAFVALLGISGLAHHLIEEPLRRFLRNRYQGLPHPARRAA
jgi:peptidoglycan/LPS O-acetylase OafA/YrhL